MMVAVICVQVADVFGAEDTKQIVLEGRKAVAAVDLAGTLCCNM